MDAPSDRVAWDRDGSVLSFTSAAGAVFGQNATAMQAVNNEAQAGVFMGDTRTVAIVFPIPLDCTAIFFAVSGATQTWTIETSKDTTNGYDGTWDSHSLTGLNAFRDVKPNYRILSQLYALSSGPVSGDLRGIRARATANHNLEVRAFHVYGTPSSLSTNERLVFWHPTSNTKLPPYWFDWGDVPRSSSADKSFRIKNLSTDFIANDIDLYPEALTPGSPAVDDMHTISGDGGSTFLASQNIASLDPGEISDVFVLRRTVPSNAQLSVWSARLAADVQEWEEVP